MKSKYLKRLWKKLKRRGCLGEMEMETPIYRFIATDRQNKKHKILVFMANNLSHAWDEIQSSPKFRNIIIAEYKGYTF